MARWIIAFEVESDDERMVTNLANDMMADYRDCAGDYLVTLYDPDIKRF